MIRKQTPLRPEETTESECNRNCIIIVAQRLNEKRNLRLFQSKQNRASVFEWNKWKNKKENTRE